MRVLRILKSAPRLLVHVLGDSFSGELYLWELYLWELCDWTLSPWETNEDNSVMRLRTGGLTWFDTHTGDSCTFLTSETASACTERDDLALRII